MITIDGRDMLTTLEELVEPRFTALVLVDIMNDYCTPGGYFDKAGADISTLKLVPKRVKPVLEAARSAGVLIVHVQQTLYPGHKVSSGPYLRMGYIKMTLSRQQGSGRAQGNPVPSSGVSIIDTWGWQIVDELTPKPGELIVRKHRSSAFAGTDLDMILRTNGIRSIVVVGDVTEGCAGSTAIDAQFHDYYPVVLRDCVATTEQDVHEAMMFLLTRRLDVVDSADVLKIWSGKTSVRPIPKARTKTRRRGQRFRDTHVTVTRPRV
ncbi:MAG: isochorismatase family cysteine hydrolase [Candidatus Binatia bacterium]